MRNREVSDAVRRLNPEIFGTGNAPEFTVANPVSVPDKTPPQANTRTFTIYQGPVAAPRMTRRDKWLKPRRPCVERYFIYRDILRGMVGDIPIVPDEVNAVFHFAMPDSWSKKRRQEMNGKPHRQRPDGDNCTKAIQDALFLEDGGVWRGAFEKRWAIHGRVELTMIWL